MNKLLEALQVDFNYTRTENGALTYRSTLDAVLDFYYHAPAKRGQNQEIIDLFMRAFAEDPVLALKALFYLRDVRNGQGERDSFRAVFTWLAQNYTNVFNALVPLVPEYGRWDDLTDLFVDQPTVAQFVRATLFNDFDAYRKDGNISLLAKWMPSVNAGKAAKKIGRKWAKALGLTEPQYRHLLSTLRGKLNLVETAMTSQQWNEIEYAHVPSRAALLYRKAFSKHDADRYVAYLEAVKAGKTKINAGTLYPYDLVRNYSRLFMYTRRDLRAVDATVEAQWKALPDYLAGSEENILVAADVSGSMFTSASMQPIDVSVSLAIYAAQRNHGAFRNNFMTFTDRPHLVTLSERGTLLNHVAEVFNAGVGYNTNIQRMFDELLDVAVLRHVPVEDMPTKLFVISDMEFDDSSVGGAHTNFELIKRKYAAAGYPMPTLVFWNVASRGKQTPVTKDERGVYLVSGASPSIFTAALNTKAVTSTDLMQDVLNSDRYAAIEHALETAHII